MLSPFLTNRGSRLTEIVTNKSPALLPRTPVSPLPAIRSVVPSDTPAGTAISIVSSATTLPSPRHALQGSFTTLPSPWHAGHTARDANVPKNVRCACSTIPDPSQVGQVLEPPFFSLPRPSHFSHVRNFSIVMRVRAPRTASMNSTVAGISRSLPARLVCPLRPSVPPPNPHMSPNISPKSSKLTLVRKPPPKGLAPPKSSQRNPPACPPAPSALPNWSYCARFWASESA